MKRFSFIDPCVVNDLFHGRKSSKFAWNSRIYECSRLIGNIGINNKIFLYFAFCVTGFTILCGSGCQKKSATPQSEGFSVRETESRWNEQFLQYAVKNLQRLDEFQGGEMRQQVIDRLNQWIRLQKTLPDWQPDAMIDTLPQRLRNIDEVKNLDKLEFTRHDGLVLQEDVWLRDVSNWARGPQLEDLARAKRLFDWTVRNIQIQRHGMGGELNINQWPWETLLLGRGTAVDRAWVFTLLARQQAIDAVLLALPPAEEKEQATAQNLDAIGKNGDEVSKSNEDNKQLGLRIWAVGVLDQDKIYIFDPELGLPIPALDGVKFDGDQLDIEPATLADAARDDRIFRQLDITDNPYPFDSKQMSNVIGLAVVSPASLSLRMAMFETKLSGDERAVLTDDPSAVAARFKAADESLQIRLWPQPFEMVENRDSFDDTRRAAIETAMKPFEAGSDLPLWKGRTLYIKGVFTGDDSATYYLQKARPSKGWLISWRNNLKLERTTEEADAIIEIYQQAKQDATYWLGMISATAGNTQVAVDYLLNRTLKESPASTWAVGAKYNLARTYESAGEFNKAIGWLQSDTLSAGRRGNLLRAKWLKDRLASQKAKAEEERKAAQPQLPGL